MFSLHVCKCTACVPGALDSSQSSLMPVLRDLMPSFGLRGFLHACVLLKGVREAKTYPRKGKHSWRGNPDLTDSLGFAGWECAPEEVVAQAWFNRLLGLCCCCPLLSVRFPPPPPRTSPSQICVFFAIWLPLHLTPLGNYCPSNSSSTSWPLLTYCSVSVGSTTPLFHLFFP